MSLLSTTLADRLREANSQPVSKTKLSDIFAEEPVDLSTFVTDRKFMGSPKLSTVQYDVVRHLEQIYLPEIYADMVEEFGTYWYPVRFINLCYVQWGKGGGKDSICRIANARAVYLLLCLKSPQAYFEMPPQDEIQSLNVAASATQAHRAFFRPLATMCRTSPWFREKLTAEPSDMSTSIRFTKHIEMVSGHSQADTLEGLNLILGIADEISAFRTKEELQRFQGKSEREPTKSADAILKLLRTSAATRFPRCYKMAAISYPRFKGDAIQQLCTRGTEDIAAKGEKSRYYVSGPFATWDVNPRVPDKSVFADDYEEDPDMAEAMYECRPKLSPNRWFKHEAAIYAALDERRSCPLHIRYYWGYDADLPPLPGKRREPGWQVEFHFDPDFRPLRGVSYAIHADMAISGDRAGVAMSHVRTWQRSDIDEDVEDPGRDEIRPVVYNDFTTAFEADPAARLPDGGVIPREVQIRWYRKLIQELVKRKFNIMLVTFDQFQSTDSIQILNTWGIESKRVSLDRNTDGYSTLRDVMYDSRLESHANPILRTELLGLTRLGNGKVDHPNGSSKDMADALAGSVMGALLLGGDEGSEPEFADGTDSSFVDAVGVKPLGSPADLTWLAEGAFSAPTSWSDMGWGGDLG